MKILKQAESNLPHRKPLKDDTHKTKDAAKTIALEKAGLTEGQVTYKEAMLDISIINAIII